ncbi:nonclathrin coat protein gamma2-COP [Danaus plexippus plexippus]|uniref:Coatomer subunit gamma n=1 Tax=Danaus plexippus plexippus TaxID=278856 RepID=A0A212FD53_DANPL|nr:nonclathrin coat protein gamma2-COP [Danaus plexippus plexippus]
MSSFKRDKKEEEEGGCFSFQNLDKTIVLQESRYFNETPVNPRKCTQILTKILFLLNQGETFSTQEATEAFFAITKLFQSNDVILRRMVYLCIKELSKLAQDVIIVTSSLTKDMTGKEDLYRAAAIRALCSVTDSTMIQAIERYMKQAIVDRNPAVSSAALVSSLHLSSTSPDLVKRWTSEAQEALNSEKSLVSYHALGILVNIRRTDKLSTMKLVTRLTKSSIKSPYTLCLLIRLAAQLVEDDASETSQAYIEFIDGCLRHKSEMVIYEAAHAIVNLRKTTRDLAPAVSVLQLFCGSSKATLRLAGARTLAKLTTKHPAAVSACTIDLENLISDPNRSVATLAVTTLLATGAESSIDRLMKQISSFVSEISDEFKIIVVKAIKRLCLKFPRKHQSLATFLAGMLRDEGGLDYKAAIADAIIALVEENPDAKETGLAHLCEFIEDCEHQVLSVRILHLLGREGPKTRHPTRYIRFIYNRVILETGPVRAAAVSAVAQFGAHIPELLPNIRVLLSRCETDEEDEVRDRAIFFNAIFNSGNEKLIRDYITHVPRVNPVLLEKALHDHAKNRPNEPFDILSVPEMEKPKREEVVEIDVKQPKQITIEEIYSQQLAKIPGIEKLGTIFKTNNPVELTEEDTEFQVRLIKHIYVRHVVLQFECTSTINFHVFENVTVKLDLPNEFEVKNMVPIKSLAFNRPESIFVIVEFPCSFLDSMNPFGAILEFVTRECHPITCMPNPGPGYIDTYPIEDFYISCADQIRTRVTGDDWEQTWESAFNVIEISDTFSLPQRDAAAAAKSVCEYLGLPKGSITGDTVKEIRGAGIFRGGAPFLVRARIAPTSAGTATMLIAARSPREDVAQLLLNAVG